MWQFVLVLIGAIMATMGIIMIYDARILTKRFFSFGDQNDASLGLKIIGFIIAIGGALLVFFCQWGRRILTTLSIGVKGDGEV